MKSCCAIPALVCLVLVSASAMAADSGAPLTASQQAAKQAIEAPLANPAVDALLQTKPTTAKECFQAATILVKLERPDLAKQFVARILAMKLNREQLAELADQFGSPAFLELAAQPELNPEAKQLSDAVLAAAKQVREDTGRVEQYLGQLRAPTLAERNQAMLGLLEAGGAAIGPMVQVLADPGREADHAAVRGALVAMGGTAVAPLLGLLEDGSPELTAQAVRILAALKADRAVPRLLGIAFGAAYEPKLRTLAQAAVEHIAGTQPAPDDAVQLLMTQAHDYFDRQQAVFGAVEGKVDLWHWEEGALRPKSYTEAAARRLLAARLARDAHAIAPDNRSAERLYVLTMLEQAAFEQGLGKPLPTEAGSPAARAIAAGPVLLEEVMQEALAGDHRAAAAAAARLLPKTASSETKPAQPEATPAEPVSAEPAPAETPAADAVPADPAYDRTAAKPEVAEVADDDAAAPSKPTDAELAETDPVETDFQAGPDLAELLVHQGASVSPLVQAAIHADRRVRMAALESILALQPTRPFAGSHYIPQSLVFLASTGGTPKALLAGPKPEEMLRLAGFLAARGISVDIATNGQEMLRMAIESPDYVLILADSRLDNPTMDIALQKLRYDYRSADLRVGVLARADEYGRAEHMVRNDAAALWFAWPHDQKTFNWQFDKLMAIERVHMVLPKERAAMAARALEMLLDISRSEQGVYEQMRALDEVALKALRVPELAERAAVLAGRTGTPAAQTALVDLASRSAAPFALRKAAVAALGASIRQHGILLTTAQIEEQYERYNTSGLQDRATQQLLAHILDYLEAPTRKPPQEPAEIQ